MVDLFFRFQWPYFKVLAKILNKSIDLNVVVWTGNRVLNYGCSLYKGLKKRFLTINKVFFLLLFIFYCGESNLFVHTHRYQSGTVTHSHLFASGTPGTPAHQHTAKQLQVIAYLTELQFFYSLVVPLFVSLLVAYLVYYRRDTRECAVCSTFYFSLRAPPVAC